jgi:D-alanine-D-alanine ligase
MGVKPKTRIGVIFGGRSVEHEISVISALQLMLAIDTEKYQVIPVYIAPSGVWYTGEELRERSFYKRIPVALEALQEVTLLPRPGIGGLTKVGRRVSQSLVSLLGADSDAEVIPVDCFLPVFHGQYGEDGCMQGLFELAGIPYTGSNVTASAVTMNKYVCKMYLQAHGVPVLPALVILRDDARDGIGEVCSWVSQQEGFSTYPLFVKPCNLGSSIGVSRVASEEDLPAALAKVFRYDTAALIEPCVSEIMEVNVSVRLVDGHAECSVVEVPVSQSGVLSYEEKYLRDGGKKSGQSQGMASLTRVIDPQDINPSIREDVLRYGQHAFSLLGCSGVARLDFIVDLTSGNVYFNELNAFPGSCAFYLWAKSHPRVLYTKLIDDMISSAFTSFANTSMLERNIGLKALK